MQLLTLSAVKRLVVLFLVLGGLVAWAWWRMVRMPGESHRGALPPLNPAERALRDLAAWQEAQGLSDFAVAGV